MPKPFAPPDDDDPPDLVSGGPPTRRPGPAPHRPTATDRATVQAMVAGGFEIATIARVRGLSKASIYRRYRTEVEAGAATVNAEVVFALLKAIREGSVPAMKWWTQSRMGWSEKITVDGSARDRPLRVVVELVGQAAPAATAPRQTEAGPAQPASRLPGTVVEFKGRE